MFNKIMALCEANGNNSSDVPAKKKTSARDIEVVVRCFALGFEFTSRAGEESKECAFQAREIASYTYTYIYKL